jgi:hypothetical protein
VPNPRLPENWYKLPTNFSRLESRGSVSGLRPEIVSKLGVIQEAFQQHVGKSYQIQITAGQEWNPKHGLFSLHHTGFAVDVRTRDLPGAGAGLVAQRICEALKRTLGPHYYVLLHQPPDPPHLHIQFSPGLRVSNPGDWPEPKRFKGVA